MEIKLQYGLDRNGRMVHIDSVRNGVACNCVCPGCGAPLVAKNGGACMKSHFAHASGSACEGAHESEIHMLAKEIIATNRMVMLPAYGSVFKGGRQQFNGIEVEQRRDDSSLQPDIVGIVGSDGGDGARLWIEVCVTHAVDAVKKSKIEQLGIACVEIDFAHFCNKELSRDELVSYIENHLEGRRWINNPKLRKRQQEQMLELQRQSEERRESVVRKEYVSAAKVKKTENDFRQQNAECEIVNHAKCFVCPWHSSRQEILSEMDLQGFPSQLKNYFMTANLKLWKNGGNISVGYKGERVLNTETFTMALPTESTDSKGRAVRPSQRSMNLRIIDFLDNHLPAILNAHGMRCVHNMRSFSTSTSDYNIACNCLEIVEAVKRRRQAHSRK